MIKNTKFIIKSVLVLLILSVVGFCFIEKGYDDAKIVCKLFKVDPDEIKNTTVKVINKYTDREYGRFEIPNQDAKYYIVGYFRLPAHRLSQVKGIHQPLMGYKRYTGEVINDWVCDECFKSSILKQKVEGCILFSPKSGWVYFKIEI